MSYILSFSNLDPSLIKQLFAEAERRHVDAQLVAEEWLRRGATTEQILRPEVTAEDRGKLLAIQKKGVATTSDIQSLKKYGVVPPLSDEERKAFMALGGTWTEEEGREFDKAVECFDQIDEEMWK